MSNLLDGIQQVAKEHKTEVDPAEFGSSEVQVMLREMAEKDKLLDPIRTAMWDLQEEFTLACHHDNNKVHIGTPEEFNLGKEGGCIRCQGQVWTERGPGIEWNRSTNDCAFRTDDRAEAKKHEAETGHRTYGMHTNVGFETMSVTEIERVLVMHPDAIPVCWKLIQKHLEFDRIYHGKDTVAHFDSKNGVYSSAEDMDSALNVYRAYKLFLRRGWDNYVPPPPVAPATLARLDGIGSYLQLPT